MRQHIVSLLFLLLASLGATAQPLCDVRTFTIRDGLVSHDISAITQTDDDLMWFTTWNGICCFDGYEFQTFRNQPGGNTSLSSNRILTVCPNSRNDIWFISYDSHIYLYDTHLCKFSDVGAMIKKVSGKDFKARTVFSLPNGHSWIVGKEGYGSYIVTDSLLDKEGGIVRYMPHGSAKGNIMKVFLSNHGDEWIFTDKGASTLSEDKNIDIVVNHLAEAGGKTIIASDDAHVMMFGKNDHKARMLATGGASKVNDIKDIDRHRVALATDKGVVIIDVRNGSTQTIATGCEAEEIHVDSRGRLWVFGSQPGISLISNKLDKARTLHASFTDPTLRTRSEKPLFIENADGTIWVVPQGETFSYYDESSGALVPYILRSPTYPSLPFPVIDRYFTDRQGNLWFTGGHMLVLVTFSKQRVMFTHVIDNDDARSVLVLHDGSTAIGMATGEVAMAAPDGTLLGYLNNNGAIQRQRTALSDKIYALSEDSLHRLWIGTKGDGIYVRNADGTMRHFTQTGEKGSLSSNNIYDFDIDTSGRMWIATYESGPCIAKEKDGNITFLTTGNGIEGYPRGKFLKARRITHDQSGTVFVSTTEGLVVMREQGPGKFQSFTSVYKDNDKSCLMTSDVMQTIITRSERMFVITAGGGIQELADKDVLHDNLRFKPVNGLDNSGGLILSAIEDFRGRLWIIRETNVNCYNPDNGKLATYSQLSSDNQFNFSEALPASSELGHKIVLAVDGGAITIRPRQMTESSFKPKIVFTSVRYQGDDKTMPILNTEELDVPSDKRNLSIQFAALDYRDNIGIKYAYKIEGKDKGWNYIAKGNTASFNNLPHGHLKLLVRSTNSDGVWADNVSVLHIYAHPTFWETGWAKLLYIIILCGLIALGIYIYSLRSEIRLLVNRWTDHLHEMRERHARLSNPKIVDPDELFLKKLKEFLEQHIDNADLKIYDLAKTMNMGRTAFQAKVKELTGMSPIDYLTTVRINRACFLLRNSSNNINEIAYSVGYSDPKYFSRVFKRTMGVTPTQYKNSALERQDIPDHTEKEPAV